MEEPISDSWLKIADIVLSKALEGTCEQEDTASSSQPVARLEGVSAQQNHEASPSTLEESNNKTQEECAPPEVPTIIKTIESSTSSTDAIPTPLVITPGHTARLPSSLARHGDAHARLDIPPPPSSAFSPQKESDPRLKYTVNVQEDVDFAGKDSLQAFDGEIFGPTLEDVTMVNYLGQQVIGRLLVTNMRMCFLQTSVEPVIPAARKPFLNLASQIQDEDLRQRSPSLSSNASNGAGLIHRHKSFMQSMSEHASRRVSSFFQPDTTAKTSSPLGNTRSLMSMDLGAAGVTTATHFFVPLGMIHQVEKTGHKHSAESSTYGLDVTTKDLRMFRFLLTPERHSRKEFYNFLTKHAFSLSSDLPWFAFILKEREFANMPGWNVYNPEAEYSRLGIGTPGCPWRHTVANEQYQLCDTYPSYLVVPATTTDEELRACAAFRSRGRVMALSWLHPTTKAAILRSSQPNVGITLKRCPEDETMALSICQITPATAENPRLVILDSRPKINAVVNQAMGQGYESTANYPYCELHFMDIENIHVMRDSLKRLRELVGPYPPHPSRWLAALEASGWLTHVKMCLLGAVEVAQTVSRERVSVLVHCSDGWDRTSQATSLAMLMLDPFYRTIMGFQILIEKEWLSFGHKFAQRTGMGDRRHDDEQRSPIFVQWADCVWQMLNQSPEAFEFNETMLVTILDHMYAGYFGTFFGNCEAQRVAEKLSERTVSLWSFINSDMETYTNPLYVPPGSGGRQEILPVVTARALSLWASYYFRWLPPSSIPAAVLPQPSDKVDETGKLVKRKSKLKKLLNK